MKYKNIKVFDFSLMPEWLWNYLVKNGMVGRDKYIAYYVGLCAHDMKICEDSCDEKELEENWGNKEKRDMIHKVDQWFIDNGAELREIVLLEQGPVSTRWDD